MDTHHRRTDAPVDRTPPPKAPRLPPPRAGMWIDSICKNSECGQPIRFEIIGVQHPGGLVTICPACETGHVLRDGVLMTTVEFQSQLHSPRK